MSPATRRRLAAIVSTDVVGYSRLMGSDETGTLAALRDHQAELIDGKISDHGGRIVKSMGDGLLVEFSSVVDAVRSMIAVQKGMAARKAEVPEDRRIILRIGVNLGDIIIDGDDNSRRRRQPRRPSAGRVRSGLDRYFRYGKRPNQEPPRCELSR